MMWRQVYRFGLLGALGALAAVQAPRGEAALVTVNTNLDVVNAADGLCSLREAIVAVDTNVASGAAAGECAAGSPAPASDRIAFVLGGVIALDPANGPLPSLGSDGRVLFDGWSAPAAGPGLAPRVFLDGTALGGAGAAGMIGLALYTDDNVVQGLAIGNFYTGVALYGYRNRLFGNHLGTNRLGTAAAPNTWGVEVRGSNHLIGTNGDNVRDAAEGNLISGNLSEGVVLNPGAGECVANRIAGNRIGTNRAGTAALGNGYAGVTILAGCEKTTVGTDSSGNGFDGHEGNLISGNGTIGIQHVDGEGSVIAGNVIGLDAAGAAAIPNAYGIFISEGVRDVRIGTNGDGLADLEERNVVSGNSSFGIYVRGDEITVAGNFVGTDVTGLAAVGNTFIGVAIDYGTGAGGTVGPITVGGAGAVFGNVISGNAGEGIVVYQADVTVQCNAVGLDAAGGPLGNAGKGIWRDTGGAVVLDANRVGFNGGGLYFEDAATLLANAIDGNGVGVESVAAVAVDATNSWWGDATGPFEPAGNPAGLGDSIVVGGAGAVLYNPWLAAAPPPCN